MGEIKHGIAWSDDYKLGNEQVDTQHQRLFELVSDLVSSCLEGQSAEKLRETIGFLIDYTIRHFNDEEALQLKFDYPDFGRHKQLHEDFKKQVGELVQSFRRSGCTEELVSNVNKVVIRWLVNHIQQEDKKIGDHIRSIRM